MDIILKKGKLVDGTGGVAYSADVAIHDDTIVGIGNFSLVYPEAQLSLN